MIDRLAELSIFRYSNRSRLQIDFLFQKVMYIDEEM